MADFQPNYRLDVEPNHVPVVVRGENRRVVLERAINNFVSAHPSAQPSDVADQYIALADLLNCLLLALMKTSHVAGRCGEAFVGLGRVEMRQVCHVLSLDRYDTAEGQHLGGRPQQGSDPNSNII